MMRLLRRAGVFRLLSSLILLSALCLCAEAEAAPSQGEAAEVIQTPAGSPCQQAPGAKRLQLERQSDGRWVLPRAILEVGEGAYLKGFIFECSLTRCEHIQERNLLSQLLYHQQAVPFSAEALLRGWQRLLKSGLFRPDSYLLIENDDPRALQFRLCGRPYAKISSIDFDYVGWRS